MQEKVAVFDSVCAIGPLKVSMLLHGISALLQTDLASSVLLAGMHSYRFLQLCQLPTASLAAL